MLYRLLLPAFCLCLSGAAAAEEFDSIRLYAEMADATYLAEPEARAVVEARSYRLDEYRSVAGVEVNYLIATDPAAKRQIIAVRGTANIDNAIIDVNFKLQTDTRAKVALHQGFAQSAQAVYRAAQTSLNKDYEIATTGHSLGGAIAVILAMYLDVDGYRLGPVTTFGQPKVTNVQGARSFAHLDVRRVVTAQDLVPLVPPLDVLDLTKPDIYWHLGREIVLLDNDQYAVLEGVKSMMRATRVINATLSPENLELHKMVHYLDRIEQRRASARLVPYETGIDLLKLFGQ